MSKALFARSRPDRPRGTAALFAVCAGLAAVVLGAGAFGLLPAVPALSLAVVIALAAPVTRLWVLALAIHAEQHRFGACRGAGFLGLGAFVTGVAVGALPWVPAGQRGLVAAVGLVVAATMYVLGLLLLPGAAATVQVRLRRALDGLSVGISLSFVAWLLFTPHGAMPGPGLVAMLVTVAGTPIVVLNGLRAARHRRAALLCAAGVELSLLGLAALAGLLAYHAPAGALLASAVPVGAGALLIWAGAWRADPTPSSLDAVDTDGSFAGYPVLAVPAGLAVLAAGYHLLTNGFFDRTSIVLAIGVSVSMVAREVLAVVDVRKYARRLASQEAHFRALVSGAKDVTMVVDDALVVRWQSPAAARQFGLSDQDVLGRQAAAR